jgi:hypothetical protein
MCHDYLVGVLKFWFHTLDHWDYLEQNNEQIKCALFDNYLSSNNRVYMTEVCVAVNNAVVGPPGDASCLVVWQK